MTINRRKRGTRSTEEWRDLVFKIKGVSPQTKLGLVRMADYMTLDRIYSRPRHLMASDLGVSERTVDTIIGNGHEAGLLSTIQRGQKGVTAVYQGLFPVVQRELNVRAEHDQNVRAEPGFSANRVVRTNTYATHVADMACGVCQDHGCDRCCA